MGAPSQLEQTASARITLLSPRNGSAKMRSSDLGQAPSEEAPQGPWARSLRPELVFLSVIAILGLVLFAGSAIAKGKAPASPSASLLAAPTRGSSGAEDASGAAATGTEREHAPLGQAASRAAASWTEAQAGGGRANSKQMIHGDGSHVLQCHGDQAELQATAFKARSIIESACTEHPWLAGFQTMFPHGHKVVLDIGCNLGYVSAELMDRFVPELGISKRALYKVQEGKTDTERCNVCDTQYYPGECTYVSDTPLLPAGIPRSVEVHCFEPGEIHFPRLVRNRAKLFRTARASSSSSSTSRSSEGAAGEEADSAGNHHHHDQRQVLSTATDSSAITPAGSSMSAGSRKLLLDTQDDAQRGDGAAEVAEAGGEGQLQEGEQQQQQQQEEEGERPSATSSSSASSSSSSTGSSGSTSSALAKLAADAESHTPRKTVGSSWGAWHLHNFAMSNASGTSRFSSGCNNGKCSLLDAGATVKTIEVKVSTVDEFVASQHLRHIDLMKVDTEGFDPLVLKGARQMFERRAVTLVTFEYHKLNFWQSISLKDTVLSMERMGYVCYFEGRPYLYKLSGACWQDKYEIREWTNVVCGVAGGAIERLLDAHSFLRVIRKGVVASHDKVTSALADGLADPEEYEAR